jgi:glycosyltransferase involved in cell wall biosynthesis
MSERDNRISFCGVYTEDTIGEVFGAADVVAIPSNWHENNTIVMREAIASHLPCIVSNASGMTEKIRDGVNGFIFPMGDSRELQHLLQRLLDHPSHLAAVKSNMFRSSLLSVEQEAYAYEQEYRRIRSGATPSG